MWIRVDANTLVWAHALRVEIQPQYEGTDRQYCLAAYCRGVEYRGVRRQVLCENAELAPLLKMLDEVMHGEIKCFGR